MCVSWLSHTSTNTTFLSKATDYFLTCFCRGERRKYAGKKSRLNRGSNSQTPGHESDTLTTEPPGRGRQDVELDKSQRFSDKNEDVAHMMISVFDGVGIIVEKEKKRWLPVFSKTLGGQNSVFWGKELIC